LDEPTPIDQHSVIAANHYYEFNPPEVIHEDKKLQAANEEQLARTEKLK
jgi:NADH-quinone oxidoreductase subunit G